MNKKQIAQTIVGALALGLVIFWLLSPGWAAGKLLGILANALVIASMVISFVAEEKKKNENR
jgi:hypothetical protein